MGGTRFPDTRWSVVLAAGEGERDDALAGLCRAYWYPLFAYLRARGYGRPEAEDLLQAFFVHLLERRAIGRADPLKGSFRGFLIGCLKWFLANQRELALAQRRGGGARMLSLDVDGTESRLADERVDPAGDVEREFDRRWAQLVMERALAQLQATYGARPELYAALKPYLTATEAEGYAEPAARLGMTPNAVKVAVHRMRAQFRSLLLNEIAITVSAPHEIEDEFRHLLRVLTTE